MDAHRRAARECNAPAAGEAEPADDAGVTALREAVRTGLAQLEPELRATVVLRFYADFAIAEIATSTGRSRGGSCTR
jgi:DNA-directed RNA polymerase specialized sigma24 family protein